MSELSDQEKISLTIDSLKEFTNLLGLPNDIYKQILLEEVFKFLLDEESDGLPLLAEEDRERDKVFVRSVGEKEENSKPECL